MLWSQFFNNLALFLVKNANFFAKFFGENIVIIVTSVPDWANFRPRGECLLWAVFRKSQKRFRTIVSALILTKIGLGRFFQKLIGSPCSGNRMETQTKVVFFSGAFVSSFFSFFVSSFLFFCRAFFAFSATKVLMSFDDK
jgi:hypothetical protein